MRDVVVGSWLWKERRENRTIPEHDDGIGRARSIEQGANGR
jgi:hypothetical protein